MQRESLDRLHHPKMEFYRELFKNSEQWYGTKDLQGKKVIVYGEQGYGDIIQFARYIPSLKDRGCDVIFLCPRELHKLFKQLDVTLLDKSCQDLPDHDYHIPSMGLPFRLGRWDVDQQYLKVEEKVDLDDGFRIGIAWEGNPFHSNASERNCPLRYFKSLTSPGYLFFMLKPEIHDVNLVADCNDFELYGSTISDFYDTAVLINSLDYVVSVDTSVVHLAGAMGKPTMCLLSERCDPRWEIEGVSWYDSVTLVRQKTPGDWDGVFKTVQDLFSTFTNLDAKPRH